MNRRLKQLRDNRGLSQSDVAQFIGVSRQMYNKYENGEVEPSLKSVRLLCKLYNTSYDFLLDGQVTYSLEENNTNRFVASPSVCYGSDKGFFQNGTQNYFSQIVCLLSKLLYFEKTKLLNLVAQSISNDVEAGKLAQNNYSSNKGFNDFSYENYIKAFNKIQQITAEVGFDSKGQKWTREEMNDR